MNYQSLQQESYKKGDLVLVVRRPMVMTHKTKGKFQPKWEGPFVVESVYSNRAYRLTTSDGDTFMMLINDRFLKKSILNMILLLIRLTLHL